MEEIKIHLKTLFESEKGNLTNVKEKIELKESIMWAHGFPDEYASSMLSVGFQNIYQLLNKEPDFFCERFFLPEKHIHTNKIYTIETQRKIEDYDIISFSLCYEPLYLNMLKLLEMSNIPFFSTERNELQPILVCGGVCPSYNPIPLEKIFDVIIVGDGEPIISKMCKIIRTNKRFKYRILEELSKIDGIYVPLFSKNKIKISRIENLDETPSSFIVSKKSLWPNYYFIEIARGCGRHCRFCMLGYMFRKPKERSIENILISLKNARKITNKLRFITPSDSDYSKIDILFTKAIGMGFDIRIGSQRADSVNKIILNGINNKKFTIAPETGSDRLRKIINKNITNLDILEAVKMALKYGIEEINLYMIIGFPYETNEDVLAIVELSKKVKEILHKNSKYPVKLSLNINCHIKKPHTPFQWEEQEFNQYFEKINLIKNLLDGYDISINCMDKTNLLIESILVRGDNLSGKILVHAYKNGGNYNAWIKALDAYGMKLDNYIRKMDYSECLPWDIVDNGVKKGFLLSELEKAKNGEYTSSCSENCNMCGVCE